MGGKPGNRINRSIRAPEIRLIGSDNQQIGLIQPRDALQIAEGEGLDLVEIAPNADPPSVKSWTTANSNIRRARRRKSPGRNRLKLSLRRLSFRWVSAITITNTGCVVPKRSFWRSDLKSEPPSLSEVGRWPIPISDALYSQS